MRDREVSLREMHRSIARSRLKLKGRWVSLQKLLRWTRRRRLDPYAPESLEKLKHKAAEFYQADEYHAIRIAKFTREILAVERFLERERSAPRRYIG